MAVAEQLIVEHQSGEPVPPIRLRAVVLGLVFSAAICAATPYNNSFLKATPLAGGHFPLAPFCLFTLLLVFFSALRRVFRGRVILGGREMLFVWVLMVLASGIAYTGLARTLFINLTAPAQFASSENHWAETIVPLMPSSWYPSDPEAVRTLYHGIAGGHRMKTLDLVRAIPWGAWVRPLCTVGLFVLLAYFVMACLVSLFSRQWLENERMNLPLLAVPSMMAQAADGNALRAFFFNRFFLAGVSVPVFLHLINGLHFYFPSVPSIPTLILTGTYFPKYGLFSAFYKLKIYIYPAFIGFAFLVSRQVSLSFWLFFLLGALVIGALAVLGYQVPEAALGLTFGPSLARPEEAQVVGAFFIFFLFLIWLSRLHLLKVARAALFLEKVPQARTEMFSLRVSAWGSVLGFCAMVLWCRRYGMPVFPAVAFLFVCFMTLLVSSRIICQGGLAYYTLTAAPMDGLLMFFGPRFFSAGGLLSASVLQKLLFLDLRESLMPSMVHAGAVKGAVSGRRLVTAGCVLAVAVGVLVSLFATLYLCYRYGLRALDTEWAVSTTAASYENVRLLLQSPDQAAHWVRVFVVAGAAVMLVLVLCMNRYPWWPIHPIGYLMAYSNAMRMLWFSFFVGWCANAICMRYGGVKLFFRLRMFFVGLIVGDFFMAGAFATAGFFLRESYQALPV
ncbi:MAG: DUF6785 family protein [Thermodesulfobacteriota bacterium]